MHLNYFPRVKFRIRMNSAYIFLVSPRLLLGSFHRILPHGAASRERENHFDSPSEIYIFFQLKKKTFLKGKFICFVCFSSEFKAHFAVGNFPMAALGVLNILDSHTHTFHHDIRNEARQCHDYAVRFE